MKNIISHILIICLVFISLYEVNAETVTVSKAEQAAFSFFSGNTMTKASASDIRLVSCGIDTKASETPYYIFNAGNEGFVIIAADDGMMPVLGYSLTGTFDAEDIPDGLALLLDSYRQNVTDLRHGKKAPADKAFLAWSELLYPTKASASVSVLVDLKTALWGQKAPYYNQCPEYQGERCVTGCANTALAILMRHYKKPDAGYGTAPSYITDTYRISVPGKTLGDPYDWENMLEDYSSGTATEAQKNAVAVLMADLGLIMQSDYGPSSTSTLNANILPGALKYLKFSASAAYKDRKPFSAEEWCTFLKNDLDAGHPVYYIGVSSDGGGHAYIVDGYDSDGRMHFNWGWNGGDNGFFYISDTDYSNNESAIFGFVPDDNWTEPATGYSLTYFQYYNSYYPIKSSIPYIAENQEFNLQTTISNNGNADYSGALKYSVRHADKTVTDITSTSINITAGNAKAFAINLTLSSVSEGDEIILYYKSGEDWILLDDGVKSLPLRYNLPDVISLDYTADGSNRKLTIHGLQNMTLNQSGITFGGKANWTFPETQILEFTNPVGEGDFTFSNGHDSYTVHLKFPAAE